MSEDQDGLGVSRIDGEYTDLGDLTRCCRMRENCYAIVGQWFDAMILRRERVEQILENRDPVSRFPCV